MEETELTPALERVAASVVETHRKRQQVEEELKAAAAVVASLHAQSSSLEASVMDLRRQLEATLAVKAHEDGALAELAAKRQAALEQLNAIARDVQKFMSDKDRTASEIVSQVEASRSKLAAVEREVTSVKGALGSLRGEASGLRDQLAQVRRSADSVESQLAETESKARELDTAIDAMAARTCKVAEELDHADRTKQHIAAASDELRTLGTTLQARQSEEQAAAAQMNQLLAEREQQRSALAHQLERIARLSQENSPVDVTGSPVYGSAPMPATQGAPQEVIPGAQRYANTLGLLGLLASIGFIAAPEAESAAELLDSGDVDKLVRSMWSRAMGGPAPAAYRLIIGSALGESGDAKGAMTFFNKALEGKHVDAFATYLVAGGLLRMKRYVDVLRIAQALGRTKNGKVLARNVEALHLQGSGRLDDAEKKFAEALMVLGHPRLHYNETMYNLGRLAQSRGDARTAVMWYEKLAQSDPSYRDIELHMDSLKASAQTA